MKTASFDYDGTLTDKRVIDYAKSLKCKKVITTQRPPELFRDVFRAANEIGATVRFCGRNSKESVLMDFEYAFHLDNKVINAERCVLLDDNFVEKCNNLLK